MTQRPILIVGTGRCGSTMVSDIICQHPDVLSISELLITTTRFCKDVEGAFPGGELSGSDFWAIQAAPSPEVSALLRAGVCFSEVIYPVGGAGMRFDAETGIPAIMQATLPHLTDRPDELYDRLEKVMRARAPASLRAHYEAMFGWLMQEFGKRVWVERSGGSTYILDRLLALFPDARFVHIVRDGIPTSHSMAQHSGYRLTLGTEEVKRHLKVDPFVSADRTLLGDLPDNFRGLLPESFEGAAIEGLDLPIEIFGASWSDHVLRGAKFLRDVPQDRVMDVRYESLCADPVAQIARLMAFIGVACTPDWLEMVAGTIRVPRSGPGAVARDEPEALVKACEPGMSLIRDKLRNGAFA